MTQYCLALIAICTVGLCGMAEDQPKDVQRIQGSWDWDPNARQSDAEPVILVERVVIKGDTLTIHYKMDGVRFTTPTKFTLNAAGSPREIDFTPTDKANSNFGKNYLGLYEVKEGQLKICYRGPGSTRPKSFNDTFTGTDQTTFLVLKRAPGK